eukprot:1584945-Alexandrium_andersonii.AAC.1
MPLDWLPPAGSPVFVGGEEPSGNPWRSSFFDRASAPASEAGPAPSRWGTPRSPVSLGDWAGRAVEPSAEALSLIHI